MPQLLATVLFAEKQASKLIGEYQERERKRAMDIEAMMTKYAEAVIEIFADPDISQEEKRVRSAELRMYMCGIFEVVSRPAKK